MRAAVVTDFYTPLELQDLLVPGPGEVLVRIETTGLCHTDIHAAHGNWPATPTPPFVPGHEGVGHVEALGTGVTGAVGDWVAHRLARQRLQAVPLLHRRLGDAVRAAGELRLLGGRHLHQAGPGARGVRAPRLRAPRWRNAVSGLGTCEHIAYLVDAVDNALTAQRAGLNSYVR